MLDRENVIRELQEYHDRSWTDERFGGTAARNERRRITGNALELLKEYEELEEFRQLLSDEVHEMAKQFRKED